MAGVTDLMAYKAKAYSKATNLEDNDGKDVLFNCVYVYSASIAKYADTPKKLAARIALMGFRGVYLSPGGTRLATADTGSRPSSRPAPTLAWRYMPHTTRTKGFLSEAGARIMPPESNFLQPERKSAARRADATLACPPTLSLTQVKSDIGLGWVWNTESGNEPARSTRIC